MKCWVKRYWEMCDEVRVDAENEHDAIEKAHEVPLTAGEYVADSLNSDPETDVSTSLSTTE